MTKKSKRVTLTASQCAVCECHDCTTRRRIVGGEPVMLCDDCRKQIKPVRKSLSHRETGREGQP